MTTFYIYEVRGHKNGATMDWHNRCEYNFAMYGVQPVLVEIMEGPDTPDFWQIVGDREWELAEENGYPKGIHYLKVRIFQSKQDTPEARQKMSDSHKGKYPHSLEVTERIRQKNIGREHSKESKQKMSDGNKGSTRKALRTLTFDQAEEIRSKYVPKKYSTYKLAKEYEVSQRCIFQILNNLTYTK